MAHSQNDCYRNLRVAQDYLERQKEIRASLLYEIESIIDSCLGVDGTSEYIRGLLSLRKNSSSSASKAILHFEKAAAKNNTKAKTYLGYLYKQGKGTKLDYEASLDWITQAAEDGDENAEYTLGYYYLKGLAGLEPDYALGYSYFKNNELPMSKYWSAFCEYYGLGTIKNQESSHEKLEGVNLPESKKLKNFFHDSEIAGFRMKEEFNISRRLSKTNFSQGNYEKDMLGTWIEADWKKEKVIRKLPLKVSLISSEPRSSEIVLSVEGRDYKATIDQMGNLKSNSLKIELPNPFSDLNTSDTLTYKIQKIEISKDLDTGAIDIDCSSWIEEYMESGPPITIRLYSQETINFKIDKSYTAYPNSFIKYLNFSFELEHASQVELSIYDFAGRIMLNKKIEELKPGKHKIEFDGGLLNKQNYIAVLTVNGFKFSRQVIKSN